MLKRLRATLASLVFLKEEEARYTARFVANLLPVAIALLVLLIAFPLMAGGFAQRLAVGAPVILACAASWSLLRQGKVRLASSVFVAGTWVVATYAIVTGGGVRAPSYVAYLVITTYAAFLVTPAAALAVFIISLLAGLAVVVAAYAGNLPPPVVVHTPTTLYAGYTACMIMIILIVLVITVEYRDAFGRLRESEGKYRALFEMLPVAVVIHQDSRVMLANPAGVVMFRAPDASSVTGDGIARYLGDEVREQVMERLRAGARGGPEAPDHLSTTLRRADGEEFPAEVFATDIVYQGRPATQVVGVDVTAMVEQQNRLLASERARADLAEHLNEEINHRARNNLAMVCGLLQMQALQEPDREVAARLREAVARMRSFVNIHEKIYATGAEEADLSKVIRQMATSLRTVFSTTAAEFCVEGTSGLLPTRAVTNLAVITNELLTNGLKHGGAEAGQPIQVRVRVERAGGRLRISVWNSGAPVPDGFDAAAQKGMGLRLVIGMAEQYGAAFRVRPAEGGTVAELEVDEAALEA